MAVVANRGLDQIVVIFDAPVDSVDDDFGTLTVTPDGSDPNNTININQQIGQTLQWNMEGNIDPVTGTWTLNNPERIHFADGMPITGPLTGTLGTPHRTLGTDTPNANTFNITLNGPFNAAAIASLTIQLFDDDGLVPIASITRLLTSTIEVTTARSIVGVGPSYLLDPAGILFDDGNWLGPSING